ncbi:MAG: MscL family protein [Gemmatimonadota bacterium]
MDFSEIAIRVGTSPEGEAVTIGIGLFINNVISFLIVAFAVFILVRNFNKLKRVEPRGPRFGLRAPARWLRARPAPPAHPRSPGRHWRTWPR